MPFDPISYITAKRAGGLSWSEIKSKLETETDYKIKPYDSNLDGKIDDTMNFTRVVAASDSKDKRGHYACDGTDDQVEINQAIQDLAT